MRRRLDLAASLVGNPSILYLDEPTTGLDPHARNGVWETIRNLVLDGTTVLLTTQYLEEADALADSIMVFDKGGVVASGRPAELKAQAGKQSLDVRPAEPAHLERVAAIVAESVGVRPTVDVVNTLVSVPVSRRYARCRSSSAGSTRPESPSPNCPCGCPAWTRCSSR